MGRAASSRPRTARPAARPFSSLDTRGICFARYFRLGLLYTSYAEK
jgi:hypothetical protein